MNSNKNVRPGEQQQRTSARNMDFDPSLPALPFDALQYSMLTHSMPCRKKLSRDHCLSVVVFKNTSGGGWLTGVRGV